MSVQTSDFDITKISDKDLCEAGRRLQEAHDYIEVTGFNIREFGTKGRPCCYIGSVKVVGNEDAGTDAKPKSQVKVALSILDDLAERPIDAYCAEAFDRPAYPGRKIELMGFETCRENGEDPRAQAEIALPVFRKAIREVQAEMERRA